MTKKFFVYRFVKVFLLGLVFLLSSVFLVYYLNQYLYRSKAGASAATLSFLPNNLSLNVGQASPEIQLLLQFQDGSSNEKIDYLKLVLNFPKDNLELMNYIDTSTSSLTRQIRVDGPMVANSSGKIIIEIGANSPGAGPTTNTSQITVAKLKFRGKSVTSNGQITIGDVQIVNNASAAITTINKKALSFSVTASCERNSDCGNNASCQNNSCVCNAGYYNCDGNWQNGCESQACTNPTNTPTPPTTPTPSATLAPGQPTHTPTPTKTSTPSPTITSPPGYVSLNLKLKFQGVMREPANNDQKTMNVRIKVGGGNLSSPVSVTGNFTLIDQRNSETDALIWQGSVNLPPQVTAGQNYYLLVKGPKHIQKKICDDNPSETTGGSYHCRSGNRVSLSSGQNNLDFSKIYLLAGDLPINGAQDGVVDSLDTSYIRNNLGETDPNVIAIADLNLDGRVDTQDWSMVIYALSIKNDEE